MTWPCRGRGVAKPLGFGVCVHCIARICYFYKIARILLDTLYDITSNMLVFRQKWRKTGKRRETNYEKVFSVCEIETTLFLL